MTPRRGRPGPPARDGVAAWRLAVLLTVWILAFVLLLGRMVDLQVVRAGKLRHLALNEQQETVRIPSRRGQIVDRMGRPLAINVEVDSIYAVPHAIADHAAFAARTAPVLGLTPAEVEARLRRGGADFAWLARRRPIAVSRALTSLGLGGEIGVLPASERDYPNGPLAASVIGFTGVDNSGLAGLELEYDRFLRGVDGTGTADRDAIGRELPQTLRIVIPPRNGDTLVLTLDAVIQHIAEDELAQELKRAHAPDGSVIVMDPRTGAILALAALPSFDPNRYQSAPPRLWKNRAVADVYEPGSTFKLILAAAAIGSGTITPADRFRDPGSIRINGFTIHDAETSEHFASLSLAGIIKYSSNVGAAQVATRLGKATYYRYIRRFGFGRPTGIDLPGEAAGIIRPINLWFGPSLQDIAFGQGISVTPIQLIVAASAMATQGLEVHPHLVAVVRDATGHVVAAPGEEPPHRVIPASVAERVLAMMREVVAGGTGVNAQIPGYVVAGKTGTAQKPSPSGGYVPGGYVASFFGIVPADHPRLAILVVVDNPRGAYYGADVAAPVFREIARRTLWYLNIPPAEPVAASRPAGADAARGPVRAVPRTPSPGVHLWPAP